MSDESTDTNEPSDVAPRGFTERFLKPKKAKREPDVFAQKIIPPSDRKKAMQTMNLVEIRLGYIAAGYAAFIGGLASFLFPKTRTVHEAPVKGVCTYPYSFHGTNHSTCWAEVSNEILLLSFITLVFALGIFLAVKFRKRVLTTFASVLAGAAFFGIAYYGVMIAAPFLIYGGWLFMRARRIQKYGTTDAKQVAGLAGQDRAARKAGQTPPNATPKATRTSSTSSTSKAKTATSTPSKRYTPKKPTRKKPTTPPAEEKKPSKWRARLEGLDKEG